MVKNIANRLRYDRDITKYLNSCHVTESLFVRASVCPFVRSSLCPLCLSGASILWGKEPRCFIEI